MSRSKGALEKEREANKMEKTRQYQGIQEAVDEMPRYNRNDGTYLEVHYDLDEDEVYTHFHCSFGFNSWTEYHDPAVIRIGCYTRRVSVDRLKADIERVIDGYEY